MAIRREIILIFLLLIAIGVIVKLIEIYNSNFGETADASKFVLEDIHSKYPGADASIMTITPKTASGSQYLEVEARVTQNADSPCPERSHLFYNYPVQNFVPQPPEVITRGCRVCTEPICTIAFPEEAIIASHTLKGTEAVQSFINVNTGASPTVSERTDSWSVRWDAAGSSVYYVAEIHRNGTVLSVKQMEKA